SDFKELSNWDNEAHYFRILKNEVQCLDCKEREEMIKEMDSTEINSEEVIDSVKTIKNNSWEEEVKDGFNNKNTASTNTGETITITMDQ
ncbi:MAG: hypothetical protein KDC64_11790, partial [Aequorivita sp.]|nr:hypothetical protein [Aequorivita sp.]